MEYDSLSGDINCVSKIVTLTMYHQKFGEKGERIPARFFIFWKTSSMKKFDFPCDWKRKSFYIWRNSSSSTVFPKGGVSTGIIYALVLLLKLMINQY